MPVPTISRVSLGDSLQQILFVEDSMVAVVDSIKPGPITIYRIWVDGSQAGADVWIKLFNNTASNISLGTSAPDCILYCPIAGPIISQEFWTGNKPGLTFSVALSAAAVLSGGTAGTVSPSAPVRVIISYQAGA